jgi:Sec-independent protein translocase protein TatA
MFGLGYGEHVVLLGIGVVLFGDKRNTDLDDAKPKT